MWTIFNITCQSHITHFRSIQIKCVSMWSLNLFAKILTILFDYTHLLLSIKIRQKYENKQSKNYLYFTNCLFLKVTFSFPTNKFPKNIIIINASYEDICVDLERENNNNTAFSYFQIAHKHLKTEIFYDWPVKYYFWRFQCMIS